MARSCDGASGSFISIPGSGILTARNPSVYMWVRDTGGTGTIIRATGPFGDFWQVELSSGVLRFREEFDFGQTFGLVTGSDITLGDDNWHHIAYRKTGDVWDKFLDGVKTTINGSITGTCPIVGGQNLFGAGGASCACEVAEVCAFTTLLTDDQIASLAQGFRLYMLFSDMGDLHDAANGIYYPMIQVDHGGEEADWGGKNSHGTQAGGISIVPDPPLVPWLFEWEKHLAASV